MAWILASFSRCDEGSYGLRQQLVNRASSLLMAGANHAFRLNDALKQGVFQKQTALVSRGTLKPAPAAPI
ncbi:hypothetical protein KL86DES1_20438 [uncultured Desulfovibrio sp.]|uniref:Uncharacterized protein n=1 Tax=uncultured Desulfovibrio sp. TaxID=167968 RepID=A0A212L3R4_9BACT|nr:hypothetical protein KL86DES1_20438 [uncultured Desulfovibrio sp.]VZH33342.1 conserved protein of unknown function [Desulfovibrio sp. 86]